jgi:N12 class adenine-specific DNA methylase/predicted nucleotidyltransferase
MANPNENLRKLYNNGLKHYSLPDFDTFTKDMKDEAKRRRFYNNMQAAYSLPDFDTFSQDIGAVSEPVQQQPQQTWQSQLRWQPEEVQPILSDTTQTQQSEQLKSEVQPIDTLQQQTWQSQLRWQPQQLQQSQQPTLPSQQRLQPSEGRQPDASQPQTALAQEPQQPSAVQTDTTQVQQPPQAQQMWKSQLQWEQGERVEPPMRLTEANTPEDGQRSKDSEENRLDSLWSRHDPNDAAEQAWAAAEQRQEAAAKEINKREWKDYLALGGGRENRIMTTAAVQHNTEVARLTNFDLDRLMEDTWNNLGEKGQQSLIDDCHQILRASYPDEDDLLLYKQAEAMARQQSNLRLYKLAVEKNRPKNELDYLKRKVGDMNMISNISKGLAVLDAGKTGDMAAYEQANEEYRQDGHKILSVVGTVGGFALDPTTWMSAGAGSAAAKGALWTGGRYLAGQGASIARQAAAQRMLTHSLTGRIISGVVGGAANFGTYEGIKEAETQFAHGGHVVGQDESGRYINEGYSADAVAKQALHGAMMGAAVGWLSPVSGNVSDKLVRGTSSTVGKIAARTGVFAGATTLEGTIFSIPEWVEGNQDAMDVWTDNMVMMVGFKAKGMIKSAGSVLGDLKKSFESPTDGSKNRFDFESRLRMRLDAPSDGMALTKDERAELERYGYGDLNSLVDSAKEEQGNPADGSLITKEAAAMVSRLTAMVQDTRVSEAARAKMYYYATGRQLPVSTIMRGEMIEDGNGGFIVESQGANGVITSRSFKSRKAADLELERIKRQAELNQIEHGELYQQDVVDYENQLQEACRKVAAKRNWDPVEVYKVYEAVMRRRTGKENEQNKALTDAQKVILSKILDEMGEFEPTTEITDAMRRGINDKYAVDIDNAIRKEANRRSESEQKAIDEYIDALYGRRNDTDTTENGRRSTPENGGWSTTENNGQRLLENHLPMLESGDVEEGPVGGGDGGEQRALPIGSNSAREQKPIGRAIMQFQDRQVEVLSGRVVMTDDGSMVDNAKSDNTIIIRDINTGEVEMVAPKDILSYEPYPTEEAPTDAAIVPTEPSERPKYGAGQISIRNSDGSQTRGWLTGIVVTEDNYDEFGLSPNEIGKYEYYVEGDFQHLHYATEQELDNIVSDFKPEKKQEEPTATPTEGAAGNSDDYQEGYTIGMQNAERFSDEELKATIENLSNEADQLTDAGNGFVAALQNEQQRRAQEAAAKASTEEPASTEPYNRGYGEATGDWGQKLTDEELDGQIARHQAKGENLPPFERGTLDGLLKEKERRTSLAGTETEENGQILSLNEIQEANNRKGASALERIPRDEKGEPIFEQAESPEIGWDGLVEFSEGDKAIAKEIADTMVEEKRKALEKAQTLKSKGKTPIEILKSKKQIAAELAKAQHEFEQWQRIAGIEQSRQDAIRSEQDAEAKRLAAERAKQEREANAAKEEAERKEREALEGIPEWHRDTPENARARGSRRYQGQLYMRQEPITDAVEGKEIAVKFSKKDIPHGRVAVIEASQLQPSHIQGQRNPRFFIDEAQPKNRSEVVSTLAAKQIAEGIRPEEITSSTTAYTGAPSVNNRGEVVQGNNRSDALRYLWNNNLPEQQSAYKQYLLDNAERLGVDAEAVNAMQQPVLVNMLDVNDAEAIRLGQMTAQDTESGGIERIKPKNAAQKLGDDMRKFANMLLRSADDEASFGQLVDNNGANVLKWMNQVGAISNTQYQSAFDGNGNITAEAKNDLQKVLYQAVFKGGTPQLEEMFEQLPSKAQRAILSTAFRDMDSPVAGKILPEIQASIVAYNELKDKAPFEAAKNMEQVLRAIENYKRQYVLDDRFVQVMPADNFSNFALHLAGLYKASDMSQTTIASYFNQMYDLAQGKVAATLFDAPDTAKYPLAEVIKKVLNIDYEPAKNGNRNDANGGADVALRNSGSSEGKLRGNEAPTSGGQAESRTEPSDRGGRVAGDSATGGDGRDAGGMAEGSDNLSKGEAETPVVNAKLSKEQNEEGKPFVVASDGSIDFGTVEPESGLTEAPIRLSLGENYVDEDGRNHGYGLLHIEASHGSQIREAGYSSVEEFVEDVAKNYTTIREGAKIGEKQTYLLEVSDERNNTLYIQLSNDGTYWNINSAGIFRKRYSRNMPKVHDRPAVGDGKGTDTTEVNSGQTEGATAPAGNSSETSDSKTNTLSTEEQTKDGKSLAQETDQTPTNVDKDGNIVDKNGAVLTLYHGTPNAEVNSLSDLEPGHRRHYEDEPVRFNGSGISFTPHRSVAEDYASDGHSKGKVFDANITLKKPFYTVGVANMTQEEASAFTEKLKSQGYDGIINYANKYAREAGTLPNEVIVFDRNSLREAAKDKQNQLQGLEGYSRDEIKQAVTDYINDMLSESGADVTIKGMEIHGSRNRGDARMDSDLDVVVEYDGDFKEDALFNVLNEEPLEIGGIKVDINPIRKEETGTLDKYMERSREYDAQKKVVKHRSGAFFNKTKEEIEEEREAAKRAFEEQYAKEAYDIIRANFSNIDPKTNDIAEIVQRCDNVGDAIAALRAKAEEQRKVAEDWASRKYKRNTTIVEGQSKASAADDYKTSIGAANERRRAANIRTAQESADWYDKIADKFEKMTGYREESPTVQSSVEAASKEVNTEPTQAQIKAGNYKKGHVQVSGFDITIENPEGSVRKGVDAGGKEWQTTMHNTYGYFKGTEGVDGDHIDVFLHTNMDEWDGKKAFVVDQTNTDGTFDEHKVMLGFNDKDVAMKAYLANYDANWAMTHPGLRISEVSMDEFKKWVDSSHRKTKPFADYANVDKVVTVTNEQLTEKEAEEYNNLVHEQDMARRDAIDAEDKEIGDTFRGQAMTEKEAKEYNKKLAEGEPSQEEEAAYDAYDKEAATDVENKAFGEMKEAEESVSNEQPTETKAEDYTIEARKDTRDNSDIYAVKFEERVSRDEFKGQKAIAKEHGGYWSNFGKKGFLFKTREDAQAFADAIMGKSEDEVADQAPLSMADMDKKPQEVRKSTSLPKEDEPIVQKVDIGGIFNDLYKKGSTKLSDHATPVEDKKPEAPKPKKRKWINDDDAEEFDKLRNNLRSHLNGGSDIVKEEEASYGKPQPKEMDAEVLRMGTRMTYLMMKGGLRSFADYAEAMVDELGDAIRPHLKPLYAATQNMEEVMNLGWDEEMDDRKTVKAFDVYNFDKQGAKDIIGTAQHIVNENASQKQTDKLIETIKGERNEQRRKEADKTSADTEAVVNQAETTASQVESQLEDARTEQDADRLHQSLNKGIEAVNKQLALLGYYEADEVDKDYNEMYGFMRNAERKATQDAHRLAAQLAKDLNIEIASNDKVKKAKYGFGSKIAHSNIAPAGGEVTITLPLDNGKELSIVLFMEPNSKWPANGRADRPSDDLVFKDGYFRAEDPEGRGNNRYLTGNHEIASDVTYDMLLADVRRAVRHLLPEDVIKPAAPLTLQPGEDLVKMAERVAREHEASKKENVEAEQPLGDLFGGLITNTQKESSNEKTNVHPRTEETGRGGQQPRPDESLGKGAAHEDERTDRAGVAGRSGKHPVSDTERGADVSGLHPGERSVAEPKNTHNNHAERGVDYAPKGEKARIDANIEAIELAKRLLESGATATPQEMTILRKYSGWGGLGAAFREGSPWSRNPINEQLRKVLTPEEYDAAVMSRNSAYYTPAPVIDAMWDIAKALGFKGGNIVEGSAGIGNILGLMPTDISERSNIHAVEIDKMTGGILSLLYPDAKVEVQGFEQTRIANGTVDLAITNVPFVTGLHVMDESGDSDLSKKFRDIHDFCIAKNVRKLREGGIGIFITSSGTLDKSQKLRNWLVGEHEGNADVVGAFRMNNQTFGGTAATSDIIVVRKRVNGQRSANAIDVSTVSPARTAAYTERGKTKDLPMLINRYFIENPENMGGEMFFGFEQGDTYRPTSMGLFPTRGADQTARMAAWVKNLSDKDWKAEQGRMAADQTSHINEALGEGVKEGSMVLDSDGNICIARSGNAVPLDVNNNKIKGHTKQECFKDYTAIKTALAEVLKYQTEHEDDKDLQPLIKKLNDAYDSFVKKYGNLNKNKNLAWMRNDVDFSSIVALETYSERGDKNGGKIIEYGKTDIFSKRIVDKETEPAPTNVKDGIIASLYKFGRIDTDYLAEHLGKSKDEIKKEMVESGLGFENPTTGQMEVSYEYLSGNVREKLRQAKEAEETAPGAYTANIKALEAVVPMNIPAHLIEFTLGSSWIDPKLYERFVKERTDLDVKLTSAGGTWHMSVPYYVNTSKNMEMGVRSEALGTLTLGHELIGAAITNKTISISKTRKLSEGGTETERDPLAESECMAKVDEIRQDFKDWAREQMQADPDMSMRMEEAYNEQFNNSVPKQIPDDFVPEHFGGAATVVGGKPFKLRPHQAKAVIRATTQPVLLAHEVGTGKTYTLITTAMEMRRLGTARKPMIVVQNATVGQFVASAKALYPNAKVLTLEDTDSNKEGRKNFYAKIRYNDWDMIVVPQSVFERIPDSIERQTQFIQDKIEEKLLVLEQMKDADPSGKSMIVKQAEREINRLKDEMSQLANGEDSDKKKDKKKEKDAKKAAVTRQNAEVKAREMLDRETDDVEDFDSMGIDAVLVDEAHEYKHLGFATAMQRGVKGVDPSYSKKSQGVFLKAQSVLEKTGGKNVVFATGTPISNTAAEIWTFMRYLMPADQMKDYGIYYFDDFVRNFGNIQQMLEFSTSGKYKENNRFAGYVNLPELVRIWSTVADTVLTREAGGVSDKIPEMEGGKATDVFLPQTRALRSIMKYVRAQLDEFEQMSGKEKKAHSYIPLTMYGIAKAAAIDGRLVQADAEDDPNSKTNEVVRQTLKTLDDTKSYNGTVAIFADNYQNKASGFNLYEDIRKKLIAHGVPAEQIIVMKPGMKINQKLEIFKKVNAGEVRVIMGSTATLGTGVNIQERLHTLIHVDAPNRPMDYTQRNGRILRQGNLHKDWGLPIRVLRFGVEDSLDVTAYQRLKTKGAIADSIMNGKQLMSNSMDNRSMEEDQDLFGDMTAQLSGSEYAMLKNQIEKEVRKLRAKQKAWEADQTYIHNRKRQITGQNKGAEQRVTENKGYLEKVEKADIGNISVGKQSFANVEAMDDFFKEQNKKKRELQEKVRTAGYSGRNATMDITVNVGGFDFKVHTEIAQDMKHEQGTLFATAPARMTYSCEELGIDKMPVKENLIKNAVSDIMQNVVTGNDFRERIESAERSIKRNNEELRSMEAREGKPFQFTEELAQAESKLAEYEELMKEEMEAKEAKYADIDKDIKEATGVEYTEEDEEEDAANEPDAEYGSGKNNNFANSYETEEGKKISYSSENSEEYNSLSDSNNNGRGYEINNSAGADNVQREDNPLQAGRDNRLNPITRPSNASGEFCKVERVFKENGSFNFTSGERIESAADVAYIFSSLEDAAKEHSFVVLVKDGKPTVVELGMGTFTSTLADQLTASLAYSRIQPDEVYFVHNHPSGALKCSPEDCVALSKIENMVDKGVAVHGVIINLKSGKYGTFISNGGWYEDYKRIPDKENKLTVHTLDKQIFAPDYDPMEQPLVRSSEDVASFLNSHRMGDRAKVSFLILSQSGRIVGNIHTPFKNIKRDVDKKARYITDRVTQFGGQRAILYGNFDLTQGQDFKNLRAAMERKAGITLLDVVNVSGNHTMSANDNGLLFEPGSNYGGANVPDLRFRPVEDEKVMSEFSDGKTVKAYRTMQVIDGKLYSPMATKVGGKSTPEIKLGVPEQAEEHPEIIKGTKIGKDGIEQGYVVIDKGLGKGSLQVAYNPYIHASRTVLNDQFTSAHIRPNLVVVEVEIPESELTSGYRADKAKDYTGEISWHSGPVSGKLSDFGRPRRVILSRYDKPVRIVPYHEVAQMIAKQLEGTDIDIPYNTVQPQLRSELERLGVPVSEEASGSVGSESDFGKAQYITDQEIERINAKQAEMAQTSEEAKLNYAERLAKKLNTPIRIVTDPNELEHADAETQEAMRRNKGFYDVKSGEVVVVLPNHRDVEDVSATVFHEVVGHKGLREVVGEENYDAFCDEVYGHLKDDLKEEINKDATRRFMKNPEKGVESARREAVDELFGRLSEKGFEDFTKAERSIWQKLKAKVLEAINKFLGSLKLPKWVKLGDNELRYMLWRSHERLTGKDSFVDMARDAAKRQELGLTGELKFREGETGDIWKDQSLGLEERITNAAIRLSNNQSGDMTLRNDAMRAIGGNLTSLRKAMALQKRYDQSTVKRVADLAKVLMQNGYLRDMTAGEMQRLLSVVKNSVGHEDVKESVQKVMDIMVNNQLRNGEATLKKLLTIKASKVDARGVKVQGELDINGQRTMEVVKRGMKLEEDDLVDHIAEAMNRMSNPDQTIADEAALEYAGLNIAFDYLQNIKRSKEDEREMRDLLKTAKEDKEAGNMTEDAYDQLVESVRDSIRKNKIERAESYFNLVGKLCDSLRDSIENAKAFRDAEKARVSEIHHNANSDMADRPYNEHHKDDRKDKWMNNEIMQFLFAPLGTFDQILRVFGNKSANGEGYLWNRFMRGWVDCRNKELDGVKNKFAQLDAKAAEIFGEGTTWGKVIRMSGSMPKATVSFRDGSTVQKHELTQGNLLYIYMVDKMSDGRVKLRKMGITSTDIGQIEAILDPRIKALGDWLQEEFLVNTRNEYNETHKRMFGASMAAIENYFPLKILANARIDKEDDVNQPNQPDGITTKTGSIIKRRFNKLALDLTGADALSVVLDHITQMEHWNAYAEWNRDLNTLRTYKRFRNQVINMTTVYGGGRNLWQNFNNLCLMAAGEYRPPVAKLDKSMVNIAKGVTAAKVSLRMFTALKQLLSAPAYVPEVSVKSIVKSIANPYGDFQWCLNNLPIFRERWHSRISGDPRLLKSNMDWKLWRNRVMEIASRIGMTPNAFVDAVTVSIGAKAMYETRLQQYLREGYPDDIAEKRAKQDATILFNQTQQSSESPFLSTMQVDGSWPSVLFTVFRNSAMSYTRQEFDAIRNLKRNLSEGKRHDSIAFMAKQIMRDWNINPDAATDEERSRAYDAANKRFRRQIKKDVMRVATFGFILQLAWNLGPYLPYLFFGNDDDEKDKMWDDAMTHSLFGSVEGLTGGDVMSSFGNMAVSGDWKTNQLTKDMPLASDINTIINKFVGGKNVEAFNDIFNLLVQSGIGINPQSITDAAVAIMDACGDDPELAHEAALFVMRIMQVPQSQLDKLYFDEVGLSGEEASKLTPKQLAQRYAAYQVKRGASLTPWSWGDEQRLGKYEKSAERKMKERLNAQIDASVSEAYADYKERHDVIAKQVSRADKLLKSDYVAGAKAYATLQQNPDFKLYQRFHTLDNNLTNLSKMWLEAQTPEEASLITETIERYRAGMVQALKDGTPDSDKKLSDLMQSFYGKYQQFHKPVQQVKR